MKLLFQEKGKRSRQLNFKRHRYFLSSTDSLTGILKKDYNEKDIRAERIAEKSENID